MEEFEFIHHNTEKKYLGLVVVDPIIAAIHFMKDRDFKIVQVTSVDWSKDLDSQYKDLYRKENANWVTEKHNIEILEFIAICSGQSIIHCKIEIKEGIEFEFEGAELYVKYSRIEQLYEPVCHLLKTYGYYASKRIWDFISEWPAYYDIVGLRLLEADSITDQMLDLMLADGVKKVEDDLREIRFYNETGLSPYY